MANVGRPTLYTPKLVEKARRYLHRKRPVRIGITGNVIADVSSEEVIPSIEGLALAIKVSRETVYDWCKDEEKQEFSDIVAAVMAKQAKTLVNLGLTGNFNSTITKLMMSKHGYKDKMDLTSDDKPIGPSPEVQAKANAALDAFLNGHASRNTTEGQ